MTEKSYHISDDKVKIVGIDHEEMARAYQEMGSLNLQLASEMYNLETESTHTVENFIKD